jgi:hypothetical protein
VAATGDQDNNEVEFEAEATAADEDKKYGARTTTKSPAMIGTRTTETQAQRRPEVLDLMVAASNASAGDEHDE